MTVVVADSRPMVAAAVEVCLAGHEIITVVGLAHATADLVERVRRHTPDVALVELTLSRGAIGALLGIGSRVLLFGDTVDAQEINSALLQGASGYVPLREAGSQDIAAAVMSISAGRAVLHPAAAAMILEQWRRMRRESEASLRTRNLTRRELEVLAAVADGLTTTAIAHRLDLAPKTVENHKSHIYRKLGTSNQAQAVSIATSRGWLPTSGTT